MGSFSLWHWLIVAGIVWWIWRALRSTTAVTAAPTAAGSALQGDGQYRLSVAACKYHQDSLQQLFKDQLARERKDASTISEGDVVTTEAAATLRLDNQNPHDSNAVEVLILGRRVGYLPRAMAAAFRSYIKRKKLRGLAFRCMAEIDLPLHTDDDFEIRLDLPQLKETP